MTIGLVDLGNTRYKWLPKASIDLASFQAEVNELSPSAEELSQRLISKNRFDQFFIASVRGDAFNQVLSEHLRRANVDCVFLTTPRITRSVKLAYSEPETFGVDRYLNLLAAQHQYPKTDLLIVSAGTAVTFDWLDKKAEHQGGCIFPGLGLLQNSLKQGVAAISIAELTSQADNLFAKSTADGISGGILHGFSSAIKEIIKAMQQQKGNNDTTVILTGGNAAWLQSRLMIPVEFEPLLLFKGMEIAIREMV